MSELHKKIQLIECPRDALQGVSNYISTSKKATYINKLIASGLFEYIDFGSFVSHKAVPQMADTVEVLKALELKKHTKLLAIVANKRGAEEAIVHEEINFIGYPFSVSEIFQKRNANTSIADAFENVKSINDLCIKNKKELVVYISMAFGNPYGEEWNEEIVMKWIDKIKALGITRFSLADTTSMADIKSIHSLFQKVITTFHTLEISAHFHSTPEESLKKVKTAYNAGCRKFEGAILGFGGCPFAQDDMVGNIPTELLLSEFVDVEPQVILDLRESFLNMIQT